MAPLTLNETSLTALGLWTLGVLCLVLGRRALREKRHRSGAVLLALAAAGLGAGIYVAGPILGASS